MNSKIAQRLRRAELTLLTNQPEPEDTKPAKDAGFTVYLAS